MITNFLTFPIHCKDDGYGLFIPLNDKYLQPCSDYVVNVELSTDLGLCNSIVIFFDSSKINGIMAGYGNFAATSFLDATYKENPTYITPSELYNLMLELDSESTVYFALSRALFPNDGECNRIYRHAIIEGGSYLLEIHDNQFYCFALYDDRLQVYSEINDKGKISPSWRKYHLDRSECFRLYEANKRNPKVAYLLEDLLYNG